MTATCWGRGEESMEVKAFPVKFIILFYVCINYRCETGKKRRHSSKERLHSCLIRRRKMFICITFWKNMPDIFFIFHMFSKMRSLCLKNFWSFFFVMAERNIKNIANIYFIQIVLLTF